MGPALNNLDALLLMPFGCGEQNMVNFVPNIVVGKYLESVNRLPDSVRHKIINHLETGRKKIFVLKEILSPLNQ